jgi:hypothetical protein
MDMDWLWTVILDYPRCSSLTVAIEDHSSGVLEKTI